MTLDEVREVLESVTYKHWQFIVTQEGRVLFLQLRFRERCACRKLGVELEHRCRKWRISPRITKSELVQTAFKAVLTAEEHEIRENFKYKSRAIFGPHFDVDRLVELYDERGWDMRINSYVPEDSGTPSERPQGDIASSIREVHRAR